ncbi:MAG: hypothetical protein Q4A71_04820 [Actinomycetaceae bacterium]|nr:hypothetical protein [Actinomycetaceae bacterium]
MSRRKALLAASAAGTLLFSLTIPTALGADSVPSSGDAKLGSAQPRNMGHRLQDVRDFSPETDPYANFMRAEIPLQPRLARNPGTQVFPNLDGKAQVMLMQGDYGNTFFDEFRANNDANHHTLQFWQYADYWSPWHGTASIGTPKALYDAKTSMWQRRGFEFGIVDIPNAAWTNAAHRNGVKSIGTIYFDPAFRPALTVEESFEKDDNGTYKVAQKLVEMAKFYGFDGYFLNDEETNLTEQQLRPFMSYLTSHGLYTQWYTNSSTRWDDSKKSWLGANGEIMNSTFFNYNWPGSEKVIDAAKADGYDPYRSLFFGIEANQGRLDNAHNTAASVPNLFQAEGDHSPRASVALFTPSDYYQRGLDDDFRDISDPNNPVHQRDGFQWMVDARQRLYFSGPHNNPARAGFDQGGDISQVAKSPKMNWGGVADFIPARSVISGSAFHTDFNIGRGLSWWNRGQVTRPEPWADMDAQSILPTWQWWVQSKDQNSTITADWDLGNTEKRSDKTGKATVAPPFKPVGAYTGGSSLAIYGHSTDTNVLKLFKTDLAVNTGSTLEIAAMPVTAPDTPVNIVLGTDRGEKQLGVPHAEAGKWAASSIKLGALAGHKITWIGIKIPATKDFQWNLGGLSIRDGRAAPQDPQHLRLDRVYEDGQVVLRWKAAAYGDVTGYRVTAVEGGRETHLGDGYTSVMYVKKAPNTDVTYRVQSIGKDGQRSAGATVKFAQAGLPKAVKVRTKAVDKVSFAGIAVSGNAPLREFADGNQSLDVTWQGGDGSCIALAKITELPKDWRNDFRTKVPCKAGKATIKIPLRDGHKVDVTVIPEGTENGLWVRSETADTLAAPMPASDLKIKDGKYRFFNPSTRDWLGLEVAFVGTDGTAQPLTKHLRGDTTRRQFGVDPHGDSLVQWRKLPAPAGTFRTRLTDTAGNTTVQDFVYEDGRVLSAKAQAGNDPEAAPPAAKPEPTPNPDPDPAPSPNPAPQPSPEPTPNPSNPTNPAAPPDHAPGSSPTLRPDPQPNQKRVHTHPHHQGKNGSSVLVNTGTTAAVAALSGITLLVVGGVMLHRRKFRKEQ